MLGNYFSNVEVSPFTAALATIVAFVSILYYILKDFDQPPGPVGLPFIGYWPFIKHDTSHLQLEEVTKKYGDVFSFKVLGHLFINLGSMKVIREVNITKSENFARFTVFNPLSYVFKDGVAFVNGEPWKVLRKYFIQAFKECGMTSMKDNLAGPFYDTINETIEELNSKNGEPMSITDLLLDKCSTIFRRTFFNDHGITNQQLRELSDAYGFMLEGMTSTKLLLCGNFARYVILPLFPSYRALDRSQKWAMDVLLKIIKEHQSTYDESNVRNTIDAYFKERNDRQRKGDPSARYFTDSALARSLLQFVTDGILTVALFIGCFFQALMEHPEEQDKIYEELLEVVGTGRQPTLEDKSNLPYTNAFILEVIRTTDFFPLYPSLQCTKETTLRGYRIPEGAVTLMNSWAANHDPETYEDPHDFKPSRFVSAPGKQRPELPIIFGVGKRACFGEGFSMTQSFLFLTTIVKNFHLTLPDGGSCKSSIFFMPDKMKICAHPRVQIS